MLDNRRKFIAISIFIFTILSISTGITALEEGPVLEELIVKRILELYSEDNGVGGFTDGTTVNMNWQDTCDALEVIDLLDSFEFVSNDIKKAINSYILQERMIALEPIDKNVTSLEEFSADENITQNTTISSQATSESTIAWEEETTNWWGTIKKTIQALHMMVGTSTSHPEKFECNLSKYEYKKG